MKEILHQNSIRNQLEYDGSFFSGKTEQLDWSWQHTHYRNWVCKRANSSFPCLLKTNSKATATIELIQLNYSSIGDRCCVLFDYTGFPNEIFRCNSYSFLSLLPTWQPQNFLDRYHFWQWYENFEWIPWAPLENICLRRKGPKPLISEGGEGSRSME